VSFAAIDTSTHEKHVQQRYRVNLCTKQKHQEVSKGNIDKNDALSFPAANRKNRSSK
jgi:hypothetical protein